MSGPGSPFITNEDGHITFYYGLKAVIVIDAAIREQDPGTKGAVFMLSPVPPGCPDQSVKLPSGSFRTNGDRTDGQADEAVTAVERGKSGLSRRPIT